uniref:Uncharacterized protein n=1 Tax=Rhizophora mucronata TaxID=61149 RepID=A0A2P2NPT2_RHIMU
MDYVAHAVIFHILYKAFCSLVKCLLAPLNLVAQFAEPIVQQVCGLRFNVSPGHLPWFHLLCALEVKV